MSSSTELVKLLQEQPETNTSELLADDQSTSGEVDLLEVLIAFAKQKKRIVQITAGTTILATIVVLLLPARYTATTTIMPPQQTQSTASMLMSQLIGSGLGSLASATGKDLGLKSPNDLYIGMLKSRTVEDAVIARFNLQNVYRKKRLSDTRKKLEEATNIMSGKDGLIDISFEDKDPKRSADVANAYVDELYKLTKHLAVSEASQRRMFFEQQLQQAEDDLANSEVALEQTQKRTGMIQLDGQAKATIEAVGRIRAQIAAKEVQLQAMGSFATEQNPDYVLVRQELAGLRTQLGKFEEGGSEKNDPIIATGKIPAAGLEFVRRYRDVKYREAIFSLMARQFEAAKLDESKDAALIQVVDPAVLPDKKSWPRTGLFIGSAMLCGILLGCIWVLCAEGFRRMRKNRRTSEQLSQLKLHATLRV